MELKLRRYVLIPLLLKGQISHARLRHVFLKMQSLEVHHPVEMQTLHLWSALRWEEKGLATGYDTTLT